MKDYTLVYQQEPEGGFTVWVEELPGCVTYGETFEEATTMIKDAVEGFLVSMKKHAEIAEVKSSGLAKIISIDTRFTSTIKLPYEAI